MTTTLVSRYRSKCDANIEEKIAHIEDKIANMKILSSQLLGSYTSKGTDLGQRRVLDQAADTFVAGQLQLVGFHPRVSDKGEGGIAL